MRLFRFKCRCGKLHNFAFKFARGVFDMPCECGRVVVFDARCRKVRAFTVESRPGPEAVRVGLREVA